MGRRDRTSATFSRVRDPLAQALQRLDPDRRIAAYSLWRFWDEVVGEQIAQRAQPRRIRDGILFVAVSSHTWMQELQFLKDTIRERLNQRLGAPLVKDLYFVSGTVRERSAPPEERATPAPVVAVPELPSTRSPEIDAVLQRLAHAVARHHAQPPARKKRQPKRTGSD